MNKIHKYNIRYGFNTIEVPVSSKLVHCGLDGAGQAAVYFQVTDSRINIFVDLFVVYTGQNIDSSKWKYFSTIKEDSLILHVLEKR